MPFHAELQYLPFVEIGLGNRVHPLRGYQKEMPSGLHTRTSLLP
jgi:hypothetical protein